MKRTAFLLLAAASPLPLAAQTVEPQPTAQIETSGDVDAILDDEEPIVITGARPRGSVIGDIPAENTLDSRDIRATGATSISELLDAVSAQTGSARGRSSGRPILLLNGQRISGFRELRDLPPEAIQRMDILPEEVALKYGYAADQRVVNIVLRPRFQATTVELRGEAASDGDYANGRAEATRLTIRNDKRTSVNLQVGGNDPLYQSDREIRLDPNGVIDERDSRTLVGAAQNARLTATHNRPIGPTAGLTMTGEAGISRNRGRFGLADYDDISLLTRNSTTVSLGLGSVANAQKGDWRLSATANADYDRTTSDSDRNFIDVLTDDKSRSVRTSLVADATANGPLLTLPAGKASTTLKAGISRTDLESDARRRDIFTQTSLGRTQGDASLSIDLPITKRDSAVGRIGFNANAGVSELSDFGTLVQYGGGVQWSPTQRLNVIGSFTREEGAPSLQDLGNPLIEIDDVPFFDAVNGETVNVTTLTGGNPQLAADRRTVWKIGANWRAMETPELRLRAEFVSQTIDNPQIGFPAATPALEAAFPERFVRDGEGNLMSVDLRPVNGSQSRRDQVRWGFDFTKQLKSAVPSREQINALRQRFMPAAQGGQSQQPQQGVEPPSSSAPTSQGTTSTDVASPQAAAQRAGRGPGGGGRGGGMFGNRNGGRINLSLTHTATLKDELEIAPGLPVLDYLDGEASGGTGGRSRHVVELQGGYYNNGIGLRLSGNWRGATRVDSGTGPDLRFGDYATLDLRLFANLGERFDLVSKHPFFIGSSLRFEVKNILNERPTVRGADGIVPYAYEADRLEPIGRTIGISFRKLFLPARFMQRGARGRSAAN
jgi:hypothetical protein